MTIPLGFIAGAAIPYHHGISLAKAKATVRLQDGSVAVVIAWPIPAEKRIGNHRRRVHGTAVKVRRGTDGPFFMVPPCDIVEVVSV